MPCALRRTSLASLLPEGPSDVWRQVSCSPFSPAALVTRAPTSILQVLLADLGSGPPLSGRFGWKQAHSSLLSVAPHTCIPRATRCPLSCLTLPRGQPRLHTRFWAAGTLGWFHRCNWGAVFLTSNPHRAKGPNGSLEKLSGSPRRPRGTGKAQTSPSESCSGAHDKLPRSPSCLRLFYCLTFPLGLAQPGSSRSRSLRRSQ